jgi:hypothetical protein
VQFAVGLYPLDGRNLAFLNFNRQDQARQRRQAINQDRAGTAFAQIAASFRKTYGMLASCAQRL